MMNELTLFLNELTLLLQVVILIVCFILFSKLFSIFRDRVNQLNNVLQESFDLQKDLVMEVVILKKKMADLEMKCDLK